MSIHSRFSVALTGIAVASLVAIGVPVSAHADPAPASGCAAVEAVVVRGTGEASPYAGGEKPFVDALVKQAPVTVSTYGVPYMATTDWNTSVLDGVTKLAAHLVSEEAACPEQRFVVFGYSQGAWVVDKALAGWSEGDDPAVSAAVGAKIAAVVMAGNPRFRSDDGFNRGTYTAGVNGDSAGWAGRLSAYADRTVDYCQSNDYVCQLTPGTTGYGPGHTVYMSTYVSDMVTFALSKLPTPTAITGRRGKCMEADGTTVQFSTCTGTAAQSWILDADGTLQALGECLDGPSTVSKAGTANPAPTQLSACDGSASQQWTLSSGHIVNSASQLCLRLTGGKVADGTLIQTWTCKATWLGEHWTLAA